MVVYLWSSTVTGFTKLHVFSTKTGSDLLTSKVKAVFLRSLCVTSHLHYICLRIFYTYYYVYLFCELLLSFKRKQIEYHINPRTIFNFKGHVMWFILKYFIGSGSLFVAFYYFWHVTGRCQVCLFVLIKLRWVVKGWLTVKNVSGYYFILCGCSFMRVLIYSSLVDYYVHYGFYYSLFLVNSAAAVCARECSSLNTVRFARTGTNFYPNGTHFEKFWEEVLPRVYGWSFPLRRAVRSAAVSRDSRFIQPSSTF